MSFIDRRRFVELYERKKLLEENINEIVDDIKFLNAVVEGLEEELAVLNKEIDKCFFRLYNL